MNMTKRQILEIIDELPDEVDIDAVIYRLYLKQKLAAAEQDVSNGRLLPQEEVVKETSRWRIPNHLSAK